MEFISNIPLIGGLLATVIPFIAVIGIVVFVHEYGHYIVGRWCGIKAEVFSIGFGKELVHWVDKRGTRWRIGALPLGGYVKFLGDRDAASNADSAALQGMSSDERAHSFAAASLWKRALTVAAGPVFNFILTIVVFAGLVTYSGIGQNDPVLGDIAPSMQGQIDLQEGDEILSVNGVEVSSFTDVLIEISETDPTQTTQISLMRDGALREVTTPYLMPAYVLGVRPLSAASRAGVLAGDVITHVNGEPIPDFETLRGFIGAAEAAVDITIRRGSESLVLEMTPTVEDVPLPEGGFEKRAIIGVTMSGFLSPRTYTPDPATALWVGANQMVAVITSSIDGLIYVAKGEVSAKNLQGPVGIAQVSGESAQQGWLEFIGLIAMISTAIGMMNLFPIPMLDGGHLVFYAIEAITGKPPEGKIADFATSLGFALILSMMVFTLFNDFARL